MNKTRLLRLSRDRRIDYVRQEFGNLPIQTLRHYAAQFGLMDVSRMGKEELLNQIIVGLDRWAEAEILQ